MPMPTYVNERPVKTGCWTEREDELLAEWQGKYGNRWCMVAKKIPGRTGQQCAQRWRHKVNPNIKKEKWTAEEDEKLLVLYEEHGGSWAQISRHLEGRTDQQCMGRWKRHLDPTITREAWTDAEDATLHDQFVLYGSQWSSIARMLPGRTAQQCRARWFQVGGGNKSSSKPATRPRQPRDDESCSDDGTAYQDGEQQSDVELSGEEDERGGWDGYDEEEEEEHWGPHIASPRGPRGRALTRGPGSGHRSSFGPGFHCTISRRTTQQASNMNFDSPVSGAGSTGGAFGDATARGSGNLDDVEEADIEAGEILTTLKSSPSPIRRMQSQGLDERASPRQRHPLNAAWRHNSTGASLAAMHAEPEAGLSHRPLHHSISAPEGHILYSPTARRAYSKAKPQQGTVDLDQLGNSGVNASLGAGPSTPQTPRTVSRLAGVSPGGWARSPSVPIMAMLQSPQAPDSDAFLRSPSSFQGLVTPDWSKKLTPQKVDPQTCPPTSQGWTPSRLGGPGRPGGRHTVARRLNVDQALKGAGQLPGSGFAPLTVPQSTQHDKTGQDSGAVAAAAGQDDVGSPAKKMRMASVFSHQQEGSASAHLQQYIAARQQSGTPNSTAAANSAFSSYSAAPQQLYIQPLCLAGSPTAASSPGIASSGSFPPAVSVTQQLPGSIQGSADPAHFFLPGTKAQLGFGHKGWGHMDGVSKQLAQQQELQTLADQPLAGTAYAHAKLEPYRPLFDKQNSARIKFDALSMGRQEAISFAEAASLLAGEAVKSQQDAATASQGTKGAGLHLGTALANGQDVGEMSRHSSGKLEREPSQGRSAATRMKLHAMLDNL